MNHPQVSRLGCPQLRQTFSPDRRSFVKAGILGATGLSLSELLRHEAAAASAGKTVRQPSVIILWMRGGPSHIDMWDPKPDAPAEVRGLFGVKPTKVPGIVLSDMLPQTGAIMDKWSLIRSLHHPVFADHTSGDHVCFTGQAPINRAENEFPSCGSIVSKQLGHQAPTMPSYVMIPKYTPGVGSAYLGIAHKPFETIADPAQPGPFRLPNFELPQGVTLERTGGRRQLLAGFDQLRREVDQTGQADAMDRIQQRAWDILTSQATRNAFDLDKEPQAVRERYGFLPEFDPKASDRCSCPAWSQRVLLARRLVEAGVRLVTVDCRWWDTHVKGFESLKLGFLPRWDQVYRALIEDLEERGLLESTLVIAWGEMGRTPVVNGNAGRDHWPACMGAALAGGPIQGGRVFGASDAKGAYPKTNPRTPNDVLATMYHHMGIDTEVQYVDNTGRPHQVLPFGKRIDELCH
jgi:Protein of unknown function (DUF1501)